MKSAFKHFVMCCRRWRWFSIETYQRFPITANICNDVFRDDEKGFTSPHLPSMRASEPPCTRSKRADTIELRTYHVYQEFPFPLRCLKQNETLLHLKLGHSKRSNIKREGTWNRPWVIWFWKSSSCFKLVFVETDNGARESPPELEWVTPLLPRVASSFRQAGVIVKPLTSSPSLVNLSRKTFAGSRTLLDRRW